MSIRMPGGATTAIRAGAGLTPARGPPPQEDVEDPVMVADTNLRNRVTRDDFLAYARRNFASLDRNHDGTLDRAEVLAACKP